MNAIYEDMARRAPAFDEAKTPSAPLGHEERSDLPHVRHRVKQARPAIENLEANDAVGFVLDDMHRLSSSGFARRTLKDESEVETARASPTDAHAGA
jgi:hypothetical protein